MNRLTDELVKRYWVRKIPKEIKFVFNEAFLETNFYEVNLDFPEPHGQYILLSRKQEDELFLKFNYAKYRATKVVKCNARLWLTRAAYFKEIIAYHNIPLCYHCIFRLKNAGLAKNELISEVFYALNSAIDSFEVDRSKFSSYFALITRHLVFSKLRYLVTRKKLSLSILNYGDHVDIKNTYETRRSDASMDVQTMFTRNRDVSKRERLIINKLFGLNGKKQIGLKNVAKELGISKQRINVIKNGAFKKIRDGFEQVVREDKMLTTL